MKVFSNAHWISENYKMKPNNWKRDGSILHYPKSGIRRIVGKGYRALGYNNRAMLKAPIFRKVIQVNSVQSAVVNITGLGYFEIYVNGKKVSDDLFSPPYSQYEKTVYYHKYDLKDYLIDGENVITVQLGNGMYNVHYNNAWNFDVCQWRGLPKFILEGEIVGDTNVRIVSDDSWFVTTGAIIGDDIYGGESYDARLELDDFGKTDFDRSKCENAVVVDSPTEELVEMNIEPIRAIKEYTPINYWKISDKKWVFDLGINITGFIKFSGSAPRGTEVKFTYSEKIEGELLDMEGHYEHTAKKDQQYLQVDQYIFKGEGVETWQPKFTYHGFQYVQVEGLDSVYETTITGILTHNDIEKIGEFKSSNEMLNKIYQAMDQSYMNNVLGIPTDCPHREKNGWTGDVNLSVEYFLLSRDSESFFAKWIRDIKDTQKQSGQICCIAPTPGWGYDPISGPVWDSTFIIIPYNMYIYRNNKQVLIDNYDAMKSYIKWQSNKAKNYIIKYGLGDWCSPGRLAHKPETPIPLTSTLYHYETLRMMGEIAQVLDKHEDSKWFTENARKTVVAVNENFIDQETGFVQGDCQTSYASVLFFDVVKDELKQKVVNRLVEHVVKHNYHLDTGILGTKFLLDVLTKHGHHDIAFKIATQEDYPSWGNWINQGATTLWENWDGKQSRNHRMFGSIASWLYNDLVGIRPDINKPGLEKVVVKPNFIDQLDWVEGSTNTPNGDVIVRWEKVEDEFKLSVTAPENSVTVLLNDKFRGSVIHQHEFDVIYQDK